MVAGLGEARKLRHVPSGLLQLNPNSEFFVRHLGRTAVQSSSCLSTASLLLNKLLYTVDNDVHLKVEIFFQVLSG